MESARDTLKEQIEKVKKIQEAVKDAGKEEKQA